MPPLALRCAGGALLAAGVAGLLFSLAGLVALGRIERETVAAVEARLALLERSLNTTADGLTSAADSLAQAGAATTALRRTTTEIERGLGDTVPLVEHVATLTGTEIPTALNASRQALTSAESAARVIDEALRLLGQVPFLGLPDYAPEQPLHQSLAEVNASLEPLPAALLGIEGDLRRSTASLSEVRRQVVVIGVNLDQIQRNLVQTQEVVAQYQVVVDDLRREVSSLRAGLPGWARFARWSLSGILIWLGLAQVGLIIQGWDLIVRSRRCAEREE